MEEEIRDEASSGGQQQRRQRIYEPQFNRPHPETSFKKKKIQFGSESHGLIASSPLADKLDRNWIGVTESSGRTIHKEITSPMAPRNLWRTASREDEGGEGDEAMMIQKENLSPPSSPVRPEHERTAATGVSVVIPRDDVAHTRETARRARANAKNALVQVFTTTRS